MKDILKVINNIMSIDQELVGEEYIKKLLKNIALYLDVKYVFIGHEIKNHGSQIQTDFFCSNGEFTDNFIYNLKDTPCEVVLSGHRVCIHSSNVAKTFPKDELLIKMGIESYVGAPVIDNFKKTKRLLVLLDDKPMYDKDFFQSVTDFLSNRASAELEKYKVEENLVTQVNLRTLELESAKREIELINRQLEDRVKDEIEKNLKSQQIIYEQSRMAIMGEMIENIAHQWKQPLSTITLSSSGIIVTNKHNLLTDEKLNESMTTIKEASLFLSTTIDDFRNFFKINKIIVSFDIKKTFEKTFRLVFSQLKVNSIEVIYDSKSINVSGLENELLQVLINILKNAKDELVKKEVNQRRLIFIKTHEENNQLFIEIKDNANGIPNNIIDNIFDSHFTTKDEDNGTGIGLYMSKQIIHNNMDGKITVKNVEFDYEAKSYKGAAFTITIPTNLDSNNQISF